MVAAVVDRAAAADREAGDTENADGTKVGGGDDRLSVRADAGGAARHAAAVPRRGAGESRAARIVGGRARRAHDGDGQRDAQRARDGRSAHALHEQGAAGGDHARDHRDRRGRDSRCSADLRLSPMPDPMTRAKRATMATATASDSSKSARSFRSSARSSTSSSRPGTCRTSTTRSASPATSPAQNRRHRLRSAAAPRRGPRARRRDEADRRPAARHGRRPTPARRSRCRWAPATLGRVLNVLGEPVDFPDRPVEATERWPIHRAGADARAAVHRAEDVRDRHQGHRPARAVSDRRQDRPVRRRRRRQDRHHHGADSQHRA